jgi:hypothetical protein
VIAQLADGRRRGGFKKTPTLGARILARSPVARRILDPYVPAELDDEFAAMLMVLSFFASVDLARNFCAETKQDLAEMARGVRRSLPDAVAQYARLGRTIHHVQLENQAAERRPRRSRRSVAMNCARAAVAESTRCAAVPEGGRLVRESTVQ